MDRLKYEQIPCKSIFYPDYASSLMLKVVAKMSTMSIFRQFMSHAGYRLSFSICNHRSINVWLMI